MPDPRFRNSVLMITHANETGAFALCVNRPLNFTLNEILQDSNIRVENMPAFPVYWGGPVSSRSLWMIHSSEWRCDSTVDVNEHWAMTSSEEMFHCMADGDCPRQFRIIMGYCGWSPGQLEAELSGQGPWKPQHSWLVAHNLGPDWLFDQDPEDLWASATTLCSHQAVDSWL